MSADLRKKEWDDYRAHRRTKHLVAQVTYVNILYSELSGWSRLYPVQARAAWPVYDPEGDRLAVRTEREDLLCLSITEFVHLDMEVDLYPIGTDRQGSPVGKWKFCWQGEGE